MTIKERIEETLGEKKEEMAQRPLYRRLSDFYEEMKREGAVLKKEYDLPPLDTVGSGVYQDMVHKSRKNG